MRSPMLTVITFLLVLVAAIPHDTFTTTPDLSASTLPPNATSPAASPQRPFTLHGSSVSAFLASPQRIASFLSTAAAQRQPPLVCIDKLDAPPVAEIHSAAQLLISLHDASELCKQDVKTKGYACDRKVRWFIAELYICGPTGKNVRCHTLAWAAKHIANNCRDIAEEGTAAGMYIFEEAGVFALVE